MREKPGKPLKNNDSFVIRAATFSIVAPVAALAMNLASVNFVRGNAVGSILVGGFSVVLILSGLVLGIIALIKGRGPHKHLRRAIMGTGLCSFMIIAMLLLLPTLLAMVKRGQ